MFLSLTHPKQNCDEEAKGQKWSSKGSAVQRGLEGVKRDLRIFREYLGVYVKNVNFRNPIQVLSGQ